MGDGSLGVGGWGMGVWELRGIGWELGDGG